MKQVVVVMVSGGILLLLGALFAVQVMHEELGISQPKPLIVENQKEKKVAVSQASTTYPKDELTLKNEKKEQVGRSNFFSDLGGGLAQLMNNVSRSFLSLVMSFVEDVLNGEQTNR